MSVGYILLVVSLVVYLHDFPVSSCEGSCTDNPVFTSPRLVVKYGDPTSARCFVCQHACQNNTFGLEKSVGKVTRNGTTLTWTVDRMTEWDTSAICYYNENSGQQCCSTLPVIVYLPPDNVTISFVNHTGPMLEGHEYTLQCTVQDVAPVENLIVTFYKGQTALRQLKQQPTSTTRSKKPVTEAFTINIRPSKEDDGVEYWCEAKLDLGAEGPQHPPVVMSQNITGTVFYKPQLQGSPYPDPIITNGEPLQLNCLAVGNPSPSYTWILPSGGLSPSNSSILTMASVIEGQYTCSVSNTMGTVTVKFNVEKRVSSTIIALVVVAAVVVVVIVIGVLIYCCVKQKRKGHYDLKKVLKFHKRHVAVPTAE